MFKVTGHQGQHRGNEVCDCVVCRVVSDIFYVGLILQGRRKMTWRLAVRISYLLKPEGRDFKFGGWVNHSMSQPADDPEKDVVRLT